MKNIHDTGYKRLFSNKTIFRQLLETFVNEAWVRELDLSTCQTIDKSFISAHYKETESDIIYKIRMKERDVYIVLLIEFQSTVDRFMVLRLLNYLTNFYMDYVASNKNVKMLPPVFPILLYNGDEPWSAPTKLADLIEAQEILGKFSIDFQYCKIVEHEYSKEQLLQIQNIVSTLFLTESYYDIELVQREFLALFQKEEDKQAVSLFLNWFKQLSEHNRIDKADYARIEQVYKNSEEVKAMLLTALQKEREDIFERGIEKGMEKGMKQIARVMLRAGEPIEKVVRFTNLSEAQIVKLKKNDG
jgi:predicted transposase/invertase (TIGR01784 family)